MLKILSLFAMIALVAVAVRRIRRRKLNFGHLPEEGKKTVEGFIDGLIAAVRTGAVDMKTPERIHVLRHPETLTVGIWDGYDYAISYIPKTKRYWLLLRKGVERMQGECLPDHPYGVGLRWLHDTALGFPENMKTLPEEPKEAAPLSDEEPRESGVQTDAVDELAAQEVAS